MTRESEILHFGRKHWNKVATLSKKKILRELFQIMSRVFFMGSKT